MNRSERSEMLSELARCGVTLAEMVVLASVLKSPITVDALARQLEFEFKGDALEQPVEEYEKAVQSCLAKRWIQEASRTQRKRYLMELRTETIPRVNDEIPAVGEADLTAQGYNIYRGVKLRRFARRSGIRTLSALLKIEIYGDTESECLCCAHSFQSSFPTYPFATRRLGQDDYVEETLARIGRPVICGAWRLNRFEIVPQGFCAVAEYLPSPSDGPT